MDKKNILISQNCNASTFFLVSIAAFYLWVDFQLVIRRPIPAEVPAAPVGHTAARNWPRVFPKTQRRTGECLGKLGEN